MLPQLVEPSEAEALKTLLRGAPEEFDEDVDGVDRRPGFVFWVIFGVLLDFWGFLLLLVLVLRTSGWFSWLFSMVFLWVFVGFSIGCPVLLKVFVFWLSKRVFFFNNLSRVVLRTSGDFFFASLKGLLVIFLL